MANECKYLISVIVPVYNTEKYLSKCIYSILDQTIKNVEIILVDDGSKDNSRRICKMFSKQNENIKYIENSHRGVANARNIGLKAATGRYVTFVDSDDYILPNCLEILVNAMRLNEVQISICNFLVEVSPEKKMKPKIVKPISDGVIALMTKEETMQMALFQDSYKSYVWGKLFILDIIRKNKISFNEKYVIYEDYDFFFSYMRYVDSSIYVAKDLYVYLQRKDGISLKKMNKMCDKEKIRSKYFAMKNVFKNVRSVSNDKILLETIIAYRVEMAAHMFLIEKDVEKQRKYLFYVRKYFDVFRAYSGLKNKQFNKVKRVFKNPFLAKKLYELRMARNNV